MQHYSRTPLLSTECFLGVPSLHNPVVLSDNRRLNWRNSRPCTSTGFSYDAQYIVWLSLSRWSCFRVCSAKGFYTFKTNSSPWDPRTISINSACENGMLIISNCCLIPHMSIRNATRFSTHKSLACSTIKIEIDKHSSTLVCSTQLTVHGMFVKRLAVAVELVHSTIVSFDIWLT